MELVSRLSLRILVTVLTLGGTQMLLYPSPSAAIPLRPASLVRETQQESKGLHNNDLVDRVGNNNQSEFYVNGESTRRFTRNAEEEEEKIPDITSVSPIPPEYLPAVRRYNDPIYKIRVAEALVLAREEAKCFTGLVRNYFVDFVHICKFSL